MQRLFAQSTFTSFTFICCMAFLPTVQANAQTNEAVTEVFLITDNSYMPYSYQNGNKISGITVSLIEKVNKKLLNYHITLKAMPWRKGLNAVRDGDALGIIGTYYSGPNRDWLYPYSQPLLEEKVVVMCNPDVALSDPITWPDSFAGLLMLNIAGYDGWLDFGVRHPQNTSVINFFEVPTTTIAYDMLRKGNADCALSEQKFAEMRLSNDNNLPEDKPHIVAVVSQNPIHIGYSHNAIANGKYPYALDFAREFDFALYRLQMERKNAQ